MTVSLTCHRGFVRHFAGATLALTVLCSGCTTTTTGGATPGSPKPSRRGEENKIDSTRVRTRDDIVQIVQFWNQPYWLQNSERVTGFKVTVYFVSGGTEKGAFVPGKILVWVYEQMPSERGGYEKKLVHGWEFTQAEAMAMRVNRLAIGGYYYGFMLHWPRELSLEGKRVEIQFGYERLSDGQIVLSSARSFRVPVPLEYVEPKQKAEP